MCDSTTAVEGKCSWDATVTPAACVKASKCEHFVAASKCVKPKIININGALTMCKAGASPATTCVTATATEFLADNCFGEPTIGTYHWTGTACEKCAGAAATDGSNSVTLFVGLIGIIAALMI